MHIGIDASRAVSKNWGGPENYSYFLIRALSRVDKKNRYTLYVNAQPPRPLANSDNFEVKYIPLPRLWTQAGLAIESFVSDIDILFIPAHTIPFIRRPSLKTVVTIHDLAAEYLAGYYKFPGRLYLNKLTEYCAKHSDRVIAVSQSTKRDIKERFGVPDERIEVVYEGYDGDLFRVPDRSKVDSVLRKHGLDKPYVLFVGTIQPRKNLVRLIEAFEKAARELPDYELVLAGKPGWLNDEIYKAQGRLGIEERVKFLGHVPDEDLPALLNGAQLLAYPSLYEGFGLVILEAMACGTPVVTSRTSSLPEVADDAGILVDPYSVDAIAEALNDVLTDDHLRQDLISKGFEWVQNFSWDKAAKETLKVFEEVHNS